MMILVWNVRGPSHRCLKTHLIQLGYAHHPSMVILIETRSSSPVSLSSFFYLQSVFPSNLWIPGSGHSGGIWLFWDIAFSL